MEDPEVAAHDAADRGDGLMVGEVVEVEREPAPFPVARQDERELIVGERLERCANPVRL